MEYRKETSVWQVATIATCVFVAIMVLAGAFGGGDAAIVVSGR